MSRKNKDDGFDTETTFADMNVEGFRWYSPKPKNGTKNVKHKVSRKEYWQMVKGAYLAILPYFAIFLLSMGVVIALAYLWLK